MGYEKDWEKNKEIEKESYDEVDSSQSILSDVSDDETVEWTEEVSDEGANSEQWDDGSYIDFNQEHGDQFPEFGDTDANDVNEDSVEETVEMNNENENSIEPDSDDDDTSEVTYTYMDMESEEDVVDEEDETSDESNLSDLLERQENARRELDNMASSVQEISEFVNEEGDIVPTRKQGKIFFEMLEIETDIRQAKRIRKDTHDVYALEDSIRRYGLLNPIHVIPYGDFYILLDGYRRLQAYISLGKTTIPAFVDYTVPVELAKYFQAEVNNVLKYTFVEKLSYGKFVEKTQPQLGANAIEQSLGLKAGEYLKMKYIDQFKNDFPEIFQQVQNERLSIEQAYKKIDKEIEKQQKEQEENVPNEEQFDNVKDENALDEIRQEADRQKLGDRKILDPVIRRSVESRAGGACECCGYGAGEPDLMGVFQVHHIIPVQYGGTDSKNNLILLCHNCHKLAHDYETSRFTPDQETYDRLNEVKRIVVLGNMLLIMRKMAIKTIREKHPNIARQMDKGVLTVGQALLKSGEDLRGEEYFGGSPYSKFLETTENLKFGGEMTGELAKVENEEGDSEDTEKDLEENGTGENREIVSEEYKESVEVEIQG